jgi:hypothetical protein
MRKLVTTVLALALILGSISAVSAASGKVKLTDIADNANEEAIQVAYDLGIVTGTPEGAYEPDKAVNRAEFAALIVRALAIPDSALASYTTTTFKDTAGYTWAVPYLAVLQQRGIMKGDGYGNAMPSRTITPNEAVTMVLRAIGYTDNASVLVGQWPANYAALGQNQNLYEDVANDVQMNKASAAQMLYNGLTAQLVQVDANSLVTLLYDPGNAGTQIPRSLLTTGLNCYRDPAAAGEKRIVNYGDAAASKINLVPKVGAYGVLYRSHVDDEVVALTDVETVFLSGKFTYKDDSGAIAGRSLNKFKALDGTEYNLSSDAQTAINGNRSTVATTASSGSAIFINGDDSGPSTIWNYVNGVAGSDSGDSKLIISAKVSGVTILELRSIAVWDARLAGQGDDFLYESGQIDGKKFNGHEFPLDNNNEVDDYGYVLSGVNSLDDIAVDNVIYIYKNKDKKIARIDIGTETQSGAITNINTADKERTIGGKVIGDSPYHHSSTWNGLETINNEGTALLDVYGRTYAFQLGEASKGNFAVWTAAGSDGFNAAEKLFDKTGKDVIYGLKSGFSAPTSGVYVPSSPNQNDRGRLIEYTLSGGNLSKMTPSTVIAKNSNSSVNAAGTIITINGTNHLIDSSVLVYIGEDPRDNGNSGEFDGADFSIGSIKDLQDDDLDFGFQYCEVDGRVKALLVNSDDAGAQKLFVMINSITQGSDGNNGEIDVVKGLDFANGANASATTWNYTNEGLHDNVDLGLNTGYTETQQRARYWTMVKFSIGEDGVLKSAVRLMDVLDKDTGTNPTIGSEAIPARYVKDSYYGGSGGTFTIRYTTNSSVEGLATFESNAVLYEKDGAGWKAVRPTEGNFKAHVDSAGNLNGEYMFLKTDTDKAYDVIIKIN